MNFRLFTSLVALSFLWVGSQIPLYIYGSVLPDIYGDIGGSTNGRWVWMVIGYLIPNAALCPFVGALSDLFGRKWVAVFGQVMLIIAPVVVSTSHTINTAIGMLLNCADARISTYLEQSRHGRRRTGGRPKRADCSCRHFGACTCPQASNIRRWSRLHHPAILSITAVGSAHHQEFKLEVQWLLGWWMEFYRPCSCHVLLQGAKPYEAIGERDPWRSRLHWRPLEYSGSGPVYDGDAVGFS